MTKVQLTILCVWDLLYNKKISKAVLGKVTELMPLNIICLKKLLRALTRAYFLCQTLKNEVEELRKTVRALTQTVDGTIEKILD